MLTPSRLGKREVPHPTSEEIELCNVAWFAGVEYYSPFWRVTPHPGPTDFIDAAWEFEVGPEGDFLCEFLRGLGDALVVIEPEFAVGEVELGIQLFALCEEGWQGLIRSP